MSAKTIYNQLRKNGMTAAGACAMLGNMNAESGLKSNIAQRGMTQLTDEEYTRQATATPFLRQSSCMTVSATDFASGRIGAAKRLSLNTPTISARVSAMKQCR